MFGNKNKKKHLLEKNSDYQYGSIKPISEDKANNIFTSWYNQAVYYLSNYPLLRNLHLFILLKEKAIIGNDKNQENFLQLALTENKCPIDAGKEHVISLQNHTNEDSNDQESEGYNHKNISLVARNRSGAYQVDDNILANLEHENQSLIESKRGQSIQIEVTKNPDNCSDASSYDKKILLHGRAIPLSEVQTARTASNVDAFWRGMYFVTDSLAPTACLSILSFDLAYYYFNPPLRYGNTLKNILSNWPSPKNLSVFYHSQNPWWPLNYTLSQTLWWPMGLMLLPPLFGLYERYKICNEKEVIYRLNNANYKKAFTENLYRLLPWDKVKKALGMAENYILWDGTRTGTNRDSFFKLVKSLAENTEQLTRLCAITSLANIVAGLHPQDTVKLTEKGMDSKQYQHIRKEALTLLQKLATVDYDQANENFVFRLIRSMYTKRQLWLLGENQQRELEPIFWTQQLFLLFSKFSYLTTLGVFGYESIRWLNNKIQCENQGQHWTYQEAMAEYLCSLCPKGNDVNFRNQFSAQGCIDGFTRTSKFASEINAVLRRMLPPIAFRNNPSALLPRNMSSIDFSQQDWRDWQEDELNETFRTLQQLANRPFQTLNLASVQVQTKPLAISHAASIANFISNHEIGRISFSNQGLGDNAAKIIYPSMVNATVTEVDLSGTVIAVNDTSLDYLIEPILDMPELTRLNLSNNPINSSTLERVLTNLATLTNFTHLSLQNIDLNVAGIQALANALPDSIEILDMSGNDLSSQDLSALAMTLSQHFLLREVNFADTNLDDFAFCSFVDAFQGDNHQTQIHFNFANNQLSVDSAICLSDRVSALNAESINLSQNNIGDQGLSLLTPSMMTGTTQQWDLSYNGITDASIEVFSEALHNNTVIEELHFSGNQISVNGITYLTPALANSTVKILGLADNKFTDQGAILFCDGTARSNTSHLISVDLSNNLLTQTSSAAISRLINSSRIQSIDVSLNYFGNNATETIITAMDGSHIKGFNMTSVGAGDSTAVSLAKIIPHHNITEFSLSGNDITDKGIQAISLSLITPVPTPDRLEDIDIPYYLQWELRQATASSRMMHIDVSENQFGTAGAHALCRVSIPAGIFPAQMNLEGNPINANFFNIHSCQVTSSSSRLQPPVVLIAAARLTRIPQHLPVTNFLTAVTQTAHDFVGSITRWDILTSGAAVGLAFREEIYQALLQRLSPENKTQLQALGKNKSLQLIQALGIFIPRQSLGLQRAGMIYDVIIKTKETYREINHESIRTNNSSVTTTFKSVAYSITNALAKALAISLAVHFFIAASNRPDIVIPLLPVLFNLFHIIERTQKGYQHNGFFGGCSGALEAVADIVPGSQLISGRTNAATLTYRM